MILALREFYIFGALNHTKPQKYYGSIIAAYMFLSTLIWHLIDGGWYFSLLTIPMLIFVFIFELYRKHKRPLLNIAVTYLGIFYIAMPFSLLNHLSTINGTFDGMFLFWIFVLLWANDTGAYLAGVTFGKHKLFERISPKKTWEGFFGGIVLSIITAFLITKYANTQFSLYIWIIISVIIVVFGTLGDLSESLFKRSINIKDSGQILPGHGGLLDRFDSLLLAIPIIFTFIYFFVK